MTNRKGYPLEALKLLSTDELTAWAIQSGRYIVDAEQGKVYNNRGRQLGYKRSGYWRVSLSFSCFVKAVDIHRMVAIQAWGVKAVQGKEIAHREGKEFNGISNLWLPESKKEHMDFDGSLPPSQRKKSWLPCTRCGDPDGRVEHSSQGNVSPSRLSGERFGIEGDICVSCYATLSSKEYNKRKRGS